MQEHEYDGRPAQGCPDGRPALMIDQGLSLIPSAVSARIEYVAYFSQQRVRQKRLLEELHARLWNAMVQNGFIGITGDIKQTHVRTNGRKLPRQVRAAHPGHHDVDYGEVYHTLAGLAETDRLLPARRFHYGISVAGENIHNELAYARFVLHQQNRLRSAGRDPR